MTAIDIEAFEARAAEAERRLNALEKKTGNAPSGETAAFPLPLFAVFCFVHSNVYAHRLHRAGTPGLPDQVIAMLQSVVDDLKQAKREQRQVRQLAFSGATESPACRSQGMP